MRTWAYTAYTVEGRRRSGIVVAESEARASAMIAEQGLLPAEIRARGSDHGSGGRMQRLRSSTKAARRGIGHDMLAVFTRQMAVLLGAGLSAAQALEAVQASGTVARLEAMAAQARAALLDGQPLSAALAGTIADLPPWFAAAVRAAEGTGDLATVFDTLADYLENAAADRAQFAAALIYPAFVAIVSIVVCGILMVSVAPEIVQMFATSGQPLPQLTRIVMTITDVVIANWLLIAAGLAGLVLLWVIVARVPALRQRRDALFLRLPLIGRFMRLAAAAQYLRTLALVIASRQPLTEAVHHAADVLDIAVLRSAAAAAGDALRRGDTLAQALAQLDFLAPVSRQLLQTGEASARLVPMSDRAAVLAETTLRTERKRAAALLDPLLMILVGTMVLIIVLAVLLPIFDLQSLIGSG